MTPTLSELQAAYHAGMMTKSQFIAEAHARHDQLFDYPNHLAESDIRSIEITTQGVEFVSRMGLRFHCDPRDHRAAPIEAINFGRYEPVDSDLFFGMLRPNQTVLDIGAHIGWYAVHAAARFPTSKVVAFEPVPSSVALLRKHQSANKLGNLTVCDFALSDRDGDLTLYVPPNVPTAASSVDLMNCHQTVAVKCRRLDDVVQEMRLIPNVLKIDVEGAELSVLQGGQRMLHRCRPIVVCEMLRKWTAAHGKHPNDTIRFMAELGYVCGYAGPGGLTLIDQVTDETTATNFCFIVKS